MNAMRQSNSKPYSFITIRTMLKSGKPSEKGQDSSP